MNGAKSRIVTFFAGLTAGLAAFHSGAGVIGALLVGVLAGGATLAIGQIAFATVRTPLIRVLIGLLYAVPASVVSTTEWTASLVIAALPVHTAAKILLAATSKSPTKAATTDVWEEEFLRLCVVNGAFFIAAVRFRHDCVRALRSAQRIAVHTIK
jgi:hypothetical protein